MGTFTDVTVAALEVTPVGYLQLEISQGRDRGRIQLDLPPGRSFREGDQVFVEAKSDEFLIFLPHGRTLPAADAEKKLIPIFVQLVKLIIFSIVEVAFFEILQNSPGGEGDDPRCCIKLGA